MPPILQPPRRSPPARELLTNLSDLPGRIRTTPRTRAKLEELEQARTGDRAALARVLRRHYAAIERMCRRMCATHTHHADDVIQDTYLAIVRNIASFRGEASFLTWAFTIARTAHGRQRRRESKDMRGAQTLSVVSHALEGPAANTRPLDELVAANELAASIAAALAALSDKDRRVLLMRDIEGWSASEVAERTGLSVAAVKTRLHRARVALRSRLSPRSCAA